ncbi:hypothetical protein EJB05_14263, partial [Eragrostis curvula]
MTPPPPPQLVEDTIAEILLRVQPDEPADLVRPSLVSKPCRRILTDAGFLRRYREFHRAPPLLGFFHNGHTPRFVPTTTTAASPVPHPEFGSNEWWAFDCQFATMAASFSTLGTMVTTSLSGIPSRAINIDCSGLVVAACTLLLLCSALYPAAITSIATSSLSIWASTECTKGSFRNGALIGDELYFTLPQCVGILKYELGKDCLSVFDPPDMCGKHASLIQMEDGSLGLTSISGSSLYPVADPRVVIKDNFLCGQIVPSK